MSPEHSPARAVLAGHAALLLGEVAVGRWLDAPPGWVPVAAQAVLGLLVGLVQIRRARGSIAAPEAPFLLWLGFWGGLVAGAAIGLTAPGALLGFGAAWLLLEQVPDDSPRARPELAAVRLGFVALGLPFLVGRWVHDLPGEALLGALPAALVPAALVMALVVGVAWLRPQVAHWACWAVSALLVLPTSAAPTPSGPGILLLTIDTLRKDDAAQMALQRRLAARGEVFTDAMSASSWTVPSLASMHTGRWPSGHGAGRNALPWLQVDPIAPDVPTLAEHLRDAGWRTGAVVCNGFVSPASGLDRGFATFDHDRQAVWAPLAITEVLGRRADGSLPWPTGDDDAEVRIDHALTWLSQAEGPWFLWVHLLDPHLPYMHATLASEDPLAVQVGPQPRLNVSAVRRGELRMTPAARQSLRDAYRQEVAHTDVHALRLLDGLDALGLTETTSVLFTVDHGEEFWDHGGFEHGHAIVPELVEVPLIWARPGGPTGARSEPVSGVDVMPTLLAAAGVTLPEGLDGVDLSGEVPADRARLVEGTLYFEQRRAALQGDWVWVQPDSVEGALYDRRWDPRWLQDLSFAHPERSAPLQRLLQDTRPAAAADGAALDRAALEALGYLEPE